jgi:AcrR family transcriptional regulator
MPKKSRAYVQRARAESAAATRRRILDAGRALLNESEVPTLSLGDVAGRAAVARSTVYMTFGSKSGLVSALIDDTLERAGFRRLVELANLSDPVEAIDRSLEQSCHLLEAELATFRRLSLLAQLDPEAAVSLEETNQGRLSAARSLARRLHRAGKLKDGVRVDEAASILWLVTSFPTFDDLYAGWGLDVDQVAERLRSIVHGTLLRSDAEAGPSGGQEPG